MKPSVVLRDVLRSAQTEFRALNQNRDLTGADRKLLKTFLLERMLGPRAQKALAESYGSNRHRAGYKIEQAAGQRLLKAKDLESWLKIDVKTIYAYAKRNLIPHITIGSAIRFPEKEVRAWLLRHSHTPAALRKRKRTSLSCAHRRKR